MLGEPVNRDEDVRVSKVVEVVDRFLAGELVLHTALLQVLFLADEEGADKTAQAIHRSPHLWWGMKRLVVDEEVEAIVVLGPTQRLISVATQQAVGASIGRVQTKCGDAPRPVFLGPRRRDGGWGCADHDPVAGWSREEIETSKAYYEAQLRECRAAVVSGDDAAPPGSLGRRRVLRVSRNQAILDLLNGALGRD